MRFETLKEQITWKKVEKVLQSSVKMVLSEIQTCGSLQMNLCVVCIEYSTVLVVLENFTIFTIFHHF